MSDERGGALGELPLFESFDDEALAALAAAVEPLSMQGGEVLMRQGEAADGAYVVQAGRLRATVTRADGTEQVVGEIGRGEIVGEMALLTEEPRSATVTAVRDSHLLRLPGDALATLFEHPQALRSVTTQLVRRLRHTMHDGPHRSPVATIAIVPLGTGPRSRDAATAICTALGHRVPSLVSMAAPEADEALDPNDLDALERDHTIVLYWADPTPTAWTERCLRQADLVLLVAEATDRPAPRRVEQAIVERRRTMPVRTELVLAHAPGTVDPHGTASWLDRRVVDRHHHVRGDRPSDADRVARLLLDRPVALVLSGGGARGMAEVGAIRALEERGVPIDVVAGTSAGALVGGAVARGWTADRVERTLREGLVGSTPLDPTFPAVALATGRKVTDKLRAASGGLDLEDTWRPFFCVSTNLSRNRAEVHRRGPGWRAVRASFAIPGVFPPVPHDGDVLVDGGLLDNLPVGRMRAEHEGALVIAVDVGSRRDLPAGSLPESCVMSGWPHLWQMLLPWRHGTEPVNIVRVMTRLTELGAEADDDDADLIIRPQVQDLPVLDFDRFDTFVERGHRAAAAALDPWLAERAAAPGGGVAW